MKGVHLLLRHLIHEDGSRFTVVVRAFRDPGMAQLIANEERNRMDAAASVLGCILTYEIKSLEVE